MSRRSNRSKILGHSRQITVHVSDEFSYRIDAWMIQFGLSSRAEAFAMMAAAGDSAVPLETVTFEAVAAGVRQSREYEVQAMVEYFKSRARIYSP